MEISYNSYLRDKIGGKHSAAIWVGIGMLLILFAMGSLSIIFSEDGTTARNHPGKPPATPSVRTAGTPEAAGDGLWDGPILYHHPPDAPVDFILVDKSGQKLHLYRYDGSYRLKKSYFCATGEKQGKKRAEKDEKTPEGIYFNDRTYRDRKVTVFGDRAFGLNYPDTFDTMAGNGGGGIFIHGSNRAVNPNSTNGCLVLENTDIADLDRRVDLKRTPVIIGHRLPYRFGVVRRDISELIPFLRQAFVPEKYAGMAVQFAALTVIGFEDRVVAVGKVRIGSPGNVIGTSRLYMAGPGNNLLVLIKREWSEEKAPVTIAEAKVPEKKVVKTAPKPAASDDTRLIALVEAWRRAWQGKRLNDYIAGYHPAFSSKGRNLAEWKTYKGRLNQRNRKISVRVSDLRVRVNGTSARVYFRQQYRSDTFKSSSYKILEFRKKGGQWKIYREDSFSRKPAGWPA